MVKNETQPEAMRSPRPGGKQVFPGLGEAVRRRRLALPRPQVAQALAAGVSPFRWIELEKRDRATMDTLEKAAVSLGLTAGQLLDLVQADSTPARITTAASPPVTRVTR